MLSKKEKKEDMMETRETFNEYIKKTRRLKTKRKKIGLISVTITYYVNKKGEVSEIINAI